MHNSDGHDLTDLSSVAAETAETPSNTQPTGTQNMSTPPPTGKSNAHMEFPAIHDITPGQLAILRTPGITVVEALRKCLTVSQRNFDTPRDTEPLGINLIMIKTIDKKPFTDEHGVVHCIVNNDGTVNQASIGAFVRTLNTTAPHSVAFAEYINTVMDPEQNLDMRTAQSALGYADKSVPPDGRLKNIWNPTANYWRENTFGRIAAGAVTTAVGVVGTVAAIRIGGGIGGVDHAIMGSMIGGGAAVAGWGAIARAASPKAGPEKEKVGGARRRWGIGVALLPIISKVLVPLVTMTFGNLLPDWAKPTPPAPPPAQVDPSIHLDPLPSAPRNSPASGEPDIVQNLQKSQPGNNWVQKLASGEIKVYNNKMLENRGNGAVGISSKRLANESLATLSSDKTNVLS